MKQGTGTIKSETKAVTLESLINTLHECETDNTCTGIFTSILGVNILIRECRVELEKPLYFAGLPVYQYTTRDEAEKAAVRAKRNGEHPVLWVPERMT